LAWEGAKKHALPSSPKQNMKRNGATRTFICSLCEQSGHLLNNQSAGKLALFHKLLRSAIIKAIN
jgi:hypothetical protein